MVTGGFTHHVHRGALAVGHFLQQLGMGSTNGNAHPFLRFVADDFLVREGWVTNGQLINHDFSACILEQFAEAVQMPSGPVVVNGNDRILV